MDRNTPTMHYVKKHEIAVFIALALLFSWLLWIPLEFFGYDVGVFGYCLYYGGSLGPVLAAVEVLLITDGWSGVRRLFHGLLQWRAGIEWYLAALLLPMALAVAILVILALSGVTVAVDRSLVDNGTTFLSQTYLAVLTAIAFFGFLVPRLLKSHGPFVSSLAAWVFFIASHLPFILVSIRNGRADYELWWAVGNVGIFFVYTWMLRGAKGSLLPLIFFNLSLNYWRGFSKGMMIASTGHDLYSLAFYLHLLAGIVIVVANWKYFIGKAPAPAVVPDTAPA